MLEPLIDDGIITMDYAMHFKETGIGVRDHGFLFKINPGDIGLLFPNPVKYDLETHEKEVIYTTKHKLT